MTLSTIAMNRIAAPLATRLHAESDAGSVAAAFGDICSEIEAALGPILGARGVAALFDRCCHSTVAVHPWFGVGPGAERSIAAVEAMQSSIARQSPAEAAAGASDFLSSFHELLSSLVGLSLTERLLRAVWTHSSSGPTAQDPPS